MREILFKARRLDNGEWVEGNYVAAEKLDKSGMEHFIIEIPTDGRTYEIDPATVCQYTGLTDKNGVKIFEGDYLCDWCEDENGGENFCAMGVVTYWEDEGKFVLADENGLCNDWTLEDEAQPENWKHLTVLGNAREEAPHEH